VKNVFVFWKQVLFILLILDIQCDVLSSSSCVFSTYYPFPDWELHTDSKTWTNSQPKLSFSFFQFVFLSFSLSLSLSYNLPLSVSLDHISLCTRNGNSFFILCPISNISLLLSYLKICPFNFCFYCHSLIIRFVPNFRFFFPITPCSVCFFYVSSRHYLWNKFSSSALMFLSVSLTREKEREEWRNRRLEKNMNEIHFDTLKSV